MRKIKWGVLSTAQIGQEQLIPAINRSENGDVVAIASRSEKVFEVAKKLQIEKAYTDYHALLRDQEIDAIYIPLPNSLHKEWVIEAAKHGKHILCEKPAALNTAELNEMIAACEKNQVIFMEAFMYQFHPQHRKVKELITSGAIGDVSYMQAGFSFVLEDDDQNIRLNQSLGGGALNDVGCYAIHSIRNILEDEPTTVYATSKTDPTYNVDTTTTGVLSFASGIKASFDCSFDIVFRNGYQIFGTQGHIEVPSAYRSDINEDGEGKIILTKSNGEKTEFVLNGDQYKLQVEHFSDCILNNKQPDYSLEKITNQMNVMAASFQSIRSRKSVDL